MKRDPQENAQALYQIADAQGGYFTAAQAWQAGYADSQQHFHVERGKWQRVDRGLFRLRDYPPGEREDLIRWSLWSRNQKGVSHLPLAGSGQHARQRPGGPGAVDPRRPGRS